MKSFSDISEDRIIFKSEYFFVIKDGFPVSPGHCLIITRAVKTTFFDLSADERAELVRVIDDVKRLIEKDHSPDGYNIGMNCGEAAGQSVMHFHCHLIPRYEGDMENPRGGIRYCVPEKGAY